MATPEGLVKAKITKWFKANNIWYTTIIPSFMGNSVGVSDFICLHKGVFFCVEAKRADDKKGPTANQVAYMEKVKYNGGLAFLVRTDADIAEMASVLKSRGLI